MRRFRFAAALLLGVACIVGWAGALPAQDDPGRITGRVLDASTGAPLVGARIGLEGLSLGALSGVGGRFSIDRVPAGEWSVRVATLGFATKTVTGVTVLPGQIALLDVALDASALAVEGFVVSAERERGTVSRSLDAQRTALGVTSAVSAEQMSRSPDSDAADAVRRVSGVTVEGGKYISVRGMGERYTTASLNGARIPSPEPERRVVPLDLFPTALLQSITTSKTFTPDQPGDFSGAQVDIRTREFPAQRQLYLSGSLTYHPDITGQTLLAAPREGRDWLAMGAASRALPPEANGYVAASRGNDVNEVVNSFRNVWSVGEQAARPAGSLGASLGGRDEVLGKEVGYLVSGTYSAGPDVALDQRRAMAGAGGTEFNRYDGSSGRYSVLWGGLANVSTTVGGHTRISLDNTYNRSAENEARIETGADEDTNANVRVERLQYTERSVRSNQLRAEHQISTRQRLDWALTTSGVERDEPDRSEYVTWLDPQMPIWFKHEEGAVRSFGALTESSVEGAVNYEWEMGSRSRPHRIRVGGLYRATGRDATSQAFRLQPFYWSATDARWQESPEEFFDGRYAGNGDDIFVLSRDRTGGAYTARDRTRAAFVMAEAALGTRVGLVGGARVERSALVLDYQSQLGSEGTADPVYTDILPSLGLNIDLNEDRKLRISVSQTLARPEYREIAPIAYREVLGGEQMIGNPDLRRTLIRNLDVRWEWYPRYDEALSVGVFAKHFTDPIEQRFLARSGTDTRTFENAESAVNYGIEIEVMRGLGFLAAPLRPLSVHANATLMRSEVDTGRSDDDARPMVGQAPYVLNAGLTFSPLESALSATLLYNVVGPRIVNARASSSQVDDVVELPRPALDLSLRLPFGSGMAGKLDLKNLLDSPHEVRQGEVTRAYYRQGRSATVGVTWTP